MSTEQIWAPWRLAYVQDAVEKTSEPVQPLEFAPGAEAGCFLCQAVADCSGGAKRHVVARGERTITVLNRYPYNNGHLLVAPRRHVARLDELLPAEQQDLLAEVTRMVGILEETLHPNGFNVGLNLGRVAGAGLPGHLHWHIVPRWNGDTNFMPVLAGVHVIPQSLEALWQLLIQRQTSEDSGDGGSSSR